MGYVHLEVTKIELGETAVIIEGTDLDSVWMMDKLDEQIEEKTVVLSFDKSNPGHSKYLMKMIQNNKAIQDMIKSKNKKVRDKVSTTGGRIMALIGQSLTVNDSFVKTA